MPSFAIVSEGVTDQTVIENILEIFGERVLKEAAFVTYAQPIRDETDSHTAPHGGWELVLDYCEHRLADALSTNDYVVIHIDTDQCHHENFDVATHDGGAERAHLDVINDVIEKIMQRIGSVLKPGDQHRLIFAIAVHSIECWLLQLIFLEERVTGCEERLRYRVRKEGLGNLTKTYRKYTVLCQEISWKSLRGFAEWNTSLGHFARQVASQCAAE